MENKKSKQFILKGRVQGVGMRYYVFRLAKSCNLKGYVKNCRNGDVEGVVVGEDANIESFFQTLNKKSPGTLTDVVITPTQTIESFKNFKVRLF